jgi:N-acetylglucosaminyldiphosphoundecaprenol N-acetyl-beta-D-mannosaminyltransferase
MEAEELILSFPVTRQVTESCVSNVVGWVKAGERDKYVACANPYSLVVAMHDPEFEAAIRSADLITPDGFGVILASRILGGEIHERVTGMDIFMGVSDMLNTQGGYSCFFLGSTSDTLQKIADRFKRDYPNLTLAGTYSPPFKAAFSDADNQMMIEAINEAEPDVLWVGMTAPKQEIWIHQNKDKLNVSVIGAVGAAFDFYAGTVRRSPHWFQKHGLEWMPRLLQQPRRLWRRTFVSAPMFLLHVVQQRLADTT